MDEETIETGFVTAAVTVPAPVAPEVPAVIPLPKLSPGSYVTLAREMAMEVRDRDVVLADYKVSDAQYEAHILTNEFYKRAFEAYCIEWKSALSTNQRIKVQAGAALEDSLPALANRMTSGRENLSSVAEVAKLFTKLAGAGEEKREGVPGEKFTINIQIGDKNLKVEANQSVPGEPILTLEPPEQIP